MTLRSVAVVVGDTSTTTPPEGYGGLARLGWAVAREFALAGVEVGLWAGRLCEDRAVYGGLVAAREGTPGPRELAAFDAVYLVDFAAFLACCEGLLRLPCVPFVVEENAPWLTPTVAENQRHVLYRADRLPRFAPGRAWVCDQVLDRDEVGPPLPPEDYVLWLGRIHRDKDPGAIVSFAEALPGVEVRVAGPLSAPRRWPRNVTLTGEVSGVEKQGLLVRAAALLYTVSPWWTGAGEGVLAEAAACGIPVLATASSPGSPASRSVASGVNGFVHPDPAALARLYPLARAMDRGRNHELAWSRLDPALAARDRLIRMERAAWALRGRQAGAGADP